MTLKQSILTELFLIQVKSKLRYPMRQKRIEIKEYREIIRNAIDSGEPISSMGDMYDIFGDPKKRAKELMELMLETDVKSYQKERKVIRIFLYVIVFFIIAYFAILISNQISRQKYHKYIDVNDNVTIYEYDNGEGQ